MPVGARPASWVVLAACLPVLWSLAHFVQLGACTCFVAFSAACLSVLWSFAGFPTLRSEATGQVVTAAKTNLLQIQAILAAQSEEGATRLRDAQISFITTRRERPSSTSASHVSQSNSQGLATQELGAQSAITARDTPSDGHSYAQTAIRGNLWRHDEF